MTLRRLARNASAILLGCGLVLQTANLFAETMTERLARKTQGKPAAQGDKDKMLVEADEIVYDNDKKTVSAVGNAHLYYQGKVLEADRVVYNRENKQVTAVGKVRLTEPGGQVVTGDKIQLTDDFKDAYIDSLRMTTPDKTRLSAPRAEREGGETTVFERALYTACEPCKDDPAKPPFWQVRAARIVHKNSERRIYYENATIEFAGVPIAWVPYFSAPDSTVKRESGFLAPRFIASSALGYGVQTPYFFNLAPNYDVTFRPTFLSNQGVLGDLEWRHRLETGSYAIRAAGIYQTNPSSFSQPPFGAGNKDFRGSIETYGKFLINEQWRWGWDLAMMTDKWFLKNYKVPSPSITQYGTSNFQESTSTLYLNGQGDRSYFNAQAYYFRVLSYADWQKRQPVVPDVIDYDKTFQGPGVIKGDWNLSFNTATIVRQQTDFTSTVTASGTPGAYYFPMANTALYSTCAPGQYNAQNCIVRGLAGTYARATAAMDWKRTLIDPLGMSWTPFGFIRGDVATAQVSTSGVFNQFLSNFMDTSGEGLTRGMAGAGMTWRYPFIGRLAGSTHVIEPVAQIIARPNETGIRQFPNEDAISLIYDDSNLFSVNKFTGYDRIEGGTRANVGLNYTMQFDSGGYINALVGQSYQVAGMNSFSQFSLTRTGLESGLDSVNSDYVGRVQYTPMNGLSVIARGRFDVNDYAPKALEVQSAYSFNSYIAANIAWARYTAQPLLGVFNTRNGFVTGLTVRPDPNWWLSGSLSFDLARYQRDNGFPQAAGNSDPWPSIPGFAIGAGYKDECTTIGVTYSNSSGSSQGITNGRVQSVMLRLELRTLGGATISQSTSGSDSSSAN
jgi:LPS-assembly protein